MILKIINFLTIILEMLIVNLLTIHQCLPKKYSNFKTFFILISITTIVIGASLPTILNGNIFSISNSVFYFIILIYLLPLKYLYNQSLANIMIILCCPWVYTILVFTISLHLSNWITLTNISLQILITQTIIYAFSVPFFIQFIKIKFLYIVHNLPTRMSNQLTAMSCIWFLTITIVYFSTIIQNELLIIISLLLITYSAFLSYYLLYKVVENLKYVECLEKITRTDYLTGLPNRSSLHDEVDKLIQSQTPFSLIFMDLDNFKTVNDQFGHLTGDQYLKGFSNYFSSIVGSQDITFYRFSGDEFICIYVGNINRIDKIKQELIDLKGKNLVDSTPFLGMSIGHARFPDDALSLHELIHIADKEMYQNKNISSNLN